MKILSANNIDRAEWSALVKASATGTWFQTPEAYEFFASMPELFKPFVVGVACDPAGAQTHLRAVCVGYVTVEKSAFKQFFTRRAIIIGGPCLADDCVNEEVIALLDTVKTKTRNLQSSDDNLPSIEQQSARKQASEQTIAQSCAAGAESQQDSSQKHASLTKNSKNIFKRYAPIYIETRNFNDYSRWKDAFASAGFKYMPHLNFHVDCRDKEAMWERMSENRCRQVRKAQVTKVMIDKMSAVEPLNDEAQIREWYEILRELYRTKVKTPLWPVEFFLEAYRQGVGKFLLVKHEGKVVGGSMVVTDGKSVYEWFECGLNTEYKEQYPSVMATWAGMQLAQETGCARYDMMGAGEPGVPYGVRDFKSEFGGELVEHGRFLCVNKPMLYRLGKLGVKILKHFRSEGV